MEVDILTAFNGLKDPRIERTKKYPLIEIIFLVVSAAISGCEGWKSIKDFGDMKLYWLRQFLPYQNGIPVDDTIARVMRSLDSKQFHECFIAWMQGIAKVTNGDVIAIDGKTARGSYDKKSGKSAIHLVSAWSTANSVVLGQEKITSKSNEITAIPELLEVLALKGCIVSIDAMGCQKEIADKIIKKKADYVLALKGNQGNLHSDVKSFFTDAIANKFLNVKHEFHEEFDKGHGRIEHRQCWVIKPSEQLDCFSNLQHWSKLNSIVMVKTKRELKEKTTEDIRFYISSCLVSAQEMLDIVRKHWHIENSLHWTLDVTFREDSSRIRKDAGPENYALIRKIALNVIKKHDSIKASVKRKLSMAALDDAFRTSLINKVI